MGALSLGSITVALISIIFVTGILANLLIEYGSPSTAQNFNQTALQANGSFVSNIYNPLKINASSALNNSNKLAQSSQLFGFSFAFILSGFGNIIAIIVQSPILFAQILTVYLQVFGIAGLPIPLIVFSIIEIMTTFLFVLGMSIWQKMPFWIT